jgi:hypothetical protein
VVTPLSPTDWELVFDGRSISLSPSIGNWDYPCRSHYWIKYNVVEWAPPWSQEEIQAGRAADALAKERYFQRKHHHPSSASITPTTPAAKTMTAEKQDPKKVNEGLWQKVKGWFVD